MTRVIELQSDDGFRSSLSIRPSLDDAIGSRREFTRRFAEGIGKLAGSTLITDNNVNKMFDEMLMFGRVLRFVYIPCTASSGLAVRLVREIANAKDSVLMQELVHRRWSVRGHPKRRVFMCPSELALDESLSHQYMGAVYYTGRSPSAMQRIVGPWAWQHYSTQRRDFRGVIDPLLSWRESIGRKRGRGDGEYKDKLQVPRQGGRAGAKELYKTGVDGLLIKIAESEGLRIDT
ncbi:hypothetical protein B296_00025696 [Ensete ventricosum]|uniref:Uncharacterized protein n=1 Tax=Ensete ventricosum TaxID=4639 RepID=A0A426X4G7_ENSVE|nr:hypothetical protein B296_00025696 [Ensete ventricosum]